MALERRSAGCGEGGFTLIELLIVVAVIGLLAAIAVPGLMSARRSGNQASAVASLRTIYSSQRTFSTTCGNGLYATALPQLGIPPASGGSAFISPDLGTAVTVSKSGYTITMAAGSDGVPGTRPACNGVGAGALSSSFYATAAPEVPGGTGTAYLWVGVMGTIFQDTVPIVSTAGFASTPGGQPIQ